MFYAFEKLVFMVIMELDHWNFSAEIDLIISRVPKNWYQSKASLIA